MGALAVLVGGLAVLVLAVLAAMGAWYVLGRAPASGAELPATGSTTEPAPATDGVTVELAAMDDTIQWVRLVGPDGTRLVNAAPKASGSVAPGTYELAAKVVARPAVKGELVVKSGGTQLVCERAKKGGAVVCTDGVSTIELK